MTDLSAITIFIDRAISQKKVPEALRAAGAIVELHIDYFPPESPDTKWLPIVSQNGWVVLTKELEDWAQFTRSVCDRTSQCQSLYPHLRQSQSSGHGRYLG